MCCVILFIENWNWPCIKKIGMGKRCTKKKKITQFNDKLTYLHDFNATRKLRVSFLICNFSFLYDNWMLSYWHLKLANVFDRCSDTFERYILTSNLLLCIKYTNHKNAIHNNTRDAFCKNQRIFYYLSCHFH